MDMQLPAVPATSAGSAVEMQDEGDGEEEEFTDEDGDGDGEGWEEEEEEEEEDDGPADAEEPPPQTLSQQKPLAPNTLVAACAICMEGICLSAMTALRCGHVYHENCIRECLRTKCECPMCRRQFATREVINLFVGDRDNSTEAAGSGMPICRRCEDYEEMSVMAHDMALEIASLRKKLKDEQLRAERLQMQLDFLPQLPTPARSSSSATGSKKKGKSAKKRLRRRSSLLAGASPRAPSASASAADPSCPKAAASPVPRARASNPFAKVKEIKAAGSTPTALRELRRVLNHTAPTDVVTHPSLSPCAPLLSRSRR